MRLLPSLLLAALLMPAVSCSGENEAAAPASTGAVPSAGAQVFAVAGCGDCHTLAAAGARGTVGPNLDRLRPSRGRVVRQVVQGGAGMPSFADSLSRNDIDLLAEYVALAAGTGAAASQGDAFEPDATTLTDCSADDSACYLQAFGNLAYRQGPKVALERFAAAIRTNPAVERGCHPIAHTIGAGALLRFHGDVGRAFADGAPTCGSGYYHGLLEWKLAGLAEGEVPGVARTVCKDTRAVSRFIYYQCVHGLGHGLMLYTRYDLPEALELCHGLESGFDRVSCTGGVFMENQQASYGEPSKWLKEDDLLYPCNSAVVAGQDKLYCYLLVTSHVLGRVGGDWKRVAGWCRKSDPEYVGICFQSMGRDASGSSRQDPDGILRLCRHARPDGEGECLFGAVRDVLNNDTPDLRARKLCESVPAEYRSSCFYGLGSMVGVAHATPAERKRACARFAGPADRADCEQGAGSVTR